MSVPLDPCLIRGLKGIMVHVTRERSAMESHGIKGEARIGARILGEIG